MRGSDERSGSLFSYVDLEAAGSSRTIRLRPIRALVDEGARGDGERVLQGLYFAGLGVLRSHLKKLLRAMLLQAFYSIRSERQLMERLEFDPPVSLVRRLGDR